MSVTMPIQTIHFHALYITMLIWNIPENHVEYVGTIYTKEVSSVGSTWDFIVDCARFMDILCVVIQIGVVTLWPKLTQVTIESSILVCAFRTQRCYTPYCLISLPSYSQCRAAIDSMLCCLLYYPYAQGKNSCVSNSASPWSQWQALRYRESDHPGYFLWQPLMPQFSKEALPLLK